LDVRHVLEQLPLMKTEPEDGGGSRVKEMWVTSKKVMNYKL
jgi:hypothetical protein